MRKAYQETLKYEGFDKTLSINLLTFKELKARAIKEYGESKINQIIEQTVHEIHDERAQSIEITDRFMHMLKGLGPSVVTFLRHLIIQLRTLLKIHLLMKLFNLFVIHL